MRSLHMLDLSQIELGLRETSCLWATFFDLDPLTARKEGWTHSLDLQKREREHLYRRASLEMFAKNGDGDVGRSGIYRSSST